MEDESEMTDCRGLDLKQSLKASLQRKLFSMHPECEYIGLSCLVHVDGSLALRQNNQNDLVSSPRADWLDLPHGASFFSGPHGILT